MARRLGLTALSSGVALASSLVLSGCLGIGSDSHRSRSERPRDAFVRGCGSRVEGELGDDWRRHSVVAGPLAFDPLRDYADTPALDYRSVASYTAGHLRTPRGRRASPRYRALLRERIRRGRNRYQPNKVLAVVEAGAEATVVVPESERSRFGLVYGGERDTRKQGYRGGDGYAVSDTSSAVTFRACRATVGPYTQFNGGFLVAGGPLCTALDVFVPGKSEPIRRTVSFGTHGRNCP